MSAIIKMTEVPLPVHEAYAAFINKLTVWWPKRYTWSKEKLVLMQIQNQVGGLCSEFGPNNFRCDWGRVLETIEGEKLLLLWQIDPNRVPQPDPDKCSQVEFRFEEISSRTTSLQVIHRHFDNHGKDHRAYQDAMNADGGWDYILQSFHNYCTK